MKILLLNFLFIFIYNQDSSIYVASEEEKIIQNIEQNKKYDIVYDEVYHTNYHNLKIHFYLNKSEHTTNPFQIEYFIYEKWNRDIIKEQGILKTEIIEDNKFFVIQSNYEMRNKTENEFFSLTLSSNTSIPWAAIVIYPVEDSTLISNIIYFAFFILFIIINIITLINTKACGDCSKSKPNPNPNPNILS